MCGIENKNTNILIVDDVKNTLEVIERNLKAWGYVTYPADGVKHAISVLENNPVDLVITDLKMPRLNGFHLIEHLEEHFPDTGIVLITGYPDMRNQNHHKESDRVKFLTKPFTDEELHDSVRSALSKKNRDIMK